MLGHLRDEDRCALLDRHPFIVQGDDATAAQPPEYLSSWAPPPSPDAPIAEHHAGTLDALDTRHRSGSSEGLLCAHGGRSDEQH